MSRLTPKMDIRSRSNRINSNPPRLTSRTIQAANSRTEIATQSQTTQSDRLLGKVNAGLGELDKAWRCIDEAMAAVEATGERWAEADIHRMAGEIALMSSKPDATKAQAHFERALEVARAQQARSWELRAAMGLARLRRDQGKRAEARDLLAPVCGWFTEGFDTRDLREAKALLEELASRRGQRQIAQETA